LELIGEGGMGEVWLAEQREPVRRRVALKLIKAGMDTREVMARFQSERQALALMDHPAIAKVFDAGSTPEGRPYFVMEFVAGIPITAYCDKHKLTTWQRMELFVQVCEGVQHSHQKAILHRDLKPSNILVSDVDGKPMPKIIDFGLAKAISHRLTAGTMYTRMGAILGTVEYMSPEQADSAGEDIDTRSDVYSLGVVLYQLLVGALWSMGYQSMPSWEWIKIPTFSPYMATRDSRL
jgi:non-specific serine/threonine protein kinase/serine/threonine-protein kinase